MTAILWPLRADELARTTAALAYALRVTCNGMTETLAFPSTGFLTSQRNAWMAGDDQADADGGVGGVGDLARMLRETLELHSENPTVTVTVSATGRVTITSSLALTILWADALTTLAAAPWGWAQTNTASATTHVAPSQAWGWWLPTMPPATDSRWRQPIVGGTRAALSGLTHTSTWGLPARERSLGWVGLSQAVALREYSPADEPRGAWEAAWLYAIGLGRELRYYVNASTRTSSSYDLATIGPDQVDDPLERDTAYPVEWSVSLELVERRP
jgi:hypothetical protein